MDSRTIALVVALFAALIVGMVVYTSLEQSNQVRIEQL